ncbi:hypothetical protein LG58_40 [Kosakonia radicincitans YD4]|nr:hypothetical protein LG58_40 [Kosakonia radicincitans YD4]
MMTSNHDDIRRIDDLFKMLNPVTIFYFDDNPQR